MAVVFPISGLLSDRLRLKEKNILPGFIDKASMIIIIIIIIIIITIIITIIIIKIDEWFISPDHKALFLGIVDYKPLLNNTRPTNSRMSSEKDPFKRLGCHLPTIISSGHLSFRYG